MKTKLSLFLPYNKFSGKRLDKILSILFIKYSRACLKKWILMNRVYIDNIICNQPDKKLFGGELVTLYPIFEEETINVPEKIYLNILYEDNDIIILNKPVGLVVHPGAGNKKGTLLNGLLYYNNNIKYLPRAGIIHRLDKNTSGLMIIAKTIISYNYLVELLKKRKIIRKYEAFVKGNMISGGIVDNPIMRNISKRTCMMVHNLGKTAVTYYKIIYRFRSCTHISLQLKTGRTHQIRVHMSYIGYPLIGDSLYGGYYYKYNKFITKKNIFIENIFNRQALHANFLSFHHPTTKKLMSWKIPLPQDMQDLLTHFKKNNLN